jgi:hypothetical protein
MQQAELKRDGPAPGGTGGRAEGIDQNTRRQSIPAGLESQAPIAINARWRVIYDGQRQWILQSREGRGWRDRRFHVERDPLLRSIHELCWPIDTPGVRAVEALPFRYPRGLNRAAAPEKSSGRAMP